MPGLADLLKNLNLPCIFIFTVLGSFSCVVVILHNFRILSLAKAQNLAGVSEGPRGADDREADREEPVDVPQLARGSPLAGR